MSERSWPTAKAKPMFLSFSCIYPTAHGHQARYTDRLTARLEALAPTRLIPWTLAGSNVWPQRINIRVFMVGFVFPQSCILHQVSSMMIQLHNLTTVDLAKTALMRLPLTGHLYLIYETSCDLLHIRFALLYARNMCWQDSWIGNSSAAAKPSALQHVHTRLVTVYSWYNVLQCICFRLEASFTHGVDEKFCKLSVIGFRESYV